MSDGRVPKSSLISREAGLPAFTPAPGSPQSAQPSMPPVPGRPMPSREVAELWFSLLRTKWTSLVLVPAHAGGSALPLARQLAGVGAMHRGRAPRLISAEGMGLSEIAQITIDMTQGSRWTMSGSSIGASGGANGDVGESGLVIVALEPIVTNPLGTAIALSADAVLLCVETGITTLESARHTIEQIGAERFVGSVLLKPE